MGMSRVETWGWGVPQVFLEANYNHKPECEKFVISIAYFSVQNLGFPSPFVTMWCVIEGCVRMSG